MNVKFDGLGDKCQHGQVSPQTSVSRTSVSMTSVKGTSVSRTSVKGTSVSRTSVNTDKCQ